VPRSHQGSFHILAAVQSRPSRRRGSHEAFLYTGGVGLSHSIGHAIGATYSIPHGITSCLSLAPTVHFKASNPEEAKQIARIIPYIGKQTAGSEEGDSHIVGDAISELVEMLGHKTTLSAVNIPVYLVTCNAADKSKYDVPTGDAEEEAIASRALHSKDHKDFANRKYLFLQICSDLANVNLVKQIIHNLY
jgi:3-oxoacid CoA-transferase